MGYFKDVTPESAGISSKGILNFLDRIEENQIELHSFMVIRHGQCAAKGWWKPYDEKFRHPLYSFSKSLTATAIGFAEQEGILSLDEKIVDIFPDLLPENPSENLKKITLHHLLIMGCGHETEIMDNSENWISTFLHHPVLHEPGTFYKYNTAGTNMLAAVLRKKTGQNVTEFLKSRLLEPLGITSLTCALLGDGTELGGGGMKMVTEDMAKFTYFLSRQGEWEGKQLLRKDWFERACRCSKRAYRRSGSAAAQRNEKSVYGREGKQACLCICSADGEPAAAGFRRNSDRRKRSVFAGDKSDSGDAILLWQR